MQQIKFIWDFRGPNGAQIANHHLIHLKEFIFKEQLDIEIFGVESVNEMHHMAFMVVPEALMKSLRDTLKPHRGQIYSEN
ncbi:hypothetical protein FJ651_07060 [Paucihalobacter ruber]|uniref:Uncharacterized protein n=1 Tax=Paucihalobacter ruber TaxID=2567861 RepID=A0A506PP26_9FLAO|nr:hypothetical protein [Paucihalobacter ruber]TPV33910.1 hypothetical protein FJ651_07060 [Paucihalobacter ruber]